MLDSWTGEEDLRQQWNFLYEQIQSMNHDTLKAAVKCSLSLASSHFSVERRKCIMKSLNNDLNSSADAQFQEGEKAIADNIKALKGVQTRKHLSRRNDSNYKPQSRCQQWQIQGWCLGCLGTTLGSKDDHRFQ